jgi:hypothetical protein
MRRDVTYNCNYSVLLPISSNGFNGARRTQIPAEVAGQYRQRMIFGGALKCAKGRVGATRR